MNIYFDLTMLSNLTLSMVSLFFVKIVATYRAKKGVLCILILGQTISVYTHYLNEIIGYLILAFFLLTMMIIIYKKKWFHASVLYLLCYYGLGFFLFMLDSNITIYRGIVTILEPTAMVKMLLIPIFALSLLLAATFVDKLYHLNNYKTQCMITYKNHHLVLSSYFDTGNTLKYLNTPVIFIAKNRWPYGVDSKTEKIEVQTVDSHHQYDGFKALLDLNDGAESYFVYVVLADQVADFNGCDCLLNAFLH